MPLTDDFDGTNPAPMVLTVTTPGGEATEVPIQGIENLTPPPRTIKKDTYTPISGDYSGLERVMLMSQQSATIEATLTYETEHHADMDAIVGTNGCTISLTFADGSVLAGVGGIEKLAVGRAEDSRHMTADITIAMDAGWTFTEGT